MYFVSHQHDTEWNDLTESARDQVRKNLCETTAKLENRLAIQALSHVVNELVSRIEALENNANH